MIVYKPISHGFSQKAAEAVWMLDSPKNIRSTDVSKSEPVRHMVQVCNPATQEAETSGLY